MGINKIDNKVMDKVANILREYGLSEIEYKNGEEYIKLTSASKACEHIVIPGNSYQPSADGNNLYTDAPCPKLCDATKYNNSSKDLDHNTAHSIIDQQFEHDYSSHPGAMMSPIVGTCYLAPSPDAPKYVEVGQEVKKGDPVLILEAMKIMNVIKAHKDGRLIHIAVADKDPVEYNQLLFVIE